MNPGFVLIENPNPLPDHSEKWLPKYNPDDGIPAKENINNFMLAMNMNRVSHEDIVVRLFPYILQGSVESWYFSLPAGSISNWETFEQVFLEKFGDDRTVTSLVNALSNLKTNLGERIKDFNSRFNKLLNKIPTASKPAVDVQIEWYISSFPSNKAIFVDRAGKATLLDNLKEALVVEKRILALEKRLEIEDIKSNKVTFSQDSKNKVLKDPFDMEGLQKVLKTMSNDMIERKK